MGVCVVRWQPSHPLERTSSFAPDPYGPFAFFSFAQVCLMVATTGKGCEDYFFWRQISPTLASDAKIHGILQGRWLRPGVPN